MKNRKRGFSLVELLIVLAVIAALIATITPVALNAIRKAKATQVAQNLKTLASAIENAAYVNGVNDALLIKNSAAGGTTKISLDDIGRDINESDYGFTYYLDADTNKYVVVVYFNKAASVDDTLVAEVLRGATTTDLLSSYTPSTISGADVEDNDGAAAGSEAIYYRIEFDLY